MKTISPADVSRSTGLRCIIWMSLISSPSVHAEDFIIPDGDIAALKQAITTANANGEDDVIRLASDGSYTLTAVDNGINGLPVITSDGDFGIIVDGNGATLRRDETATDFRLIDAAAKSLTLNDLTLINGSAVEASGFDELGGGIVSECDTLTINRCKFEDNSAGSIGGAIFHDIGLLIMTDCEFIRNSAVRGGAIFNAAEIIWRGGGAEDNQSTSTSRGGGAIFNVGILLINGVTLDANTSAGRGGAILNDFGEIEVIDTTFTTNQSVLSGGAIMSTEGEVEVRNCLFDANFAQPGGSGNGGAIHLDPFTNGRIQGSTFIGNHADGGGALESEGSTEVRDCHFERNVANVTGGGAVLNLSLMEITRCLFNENEATSTDGDGNGAAIANLDSESGDRLTVTDCELTGNIAAGSGGGIYNTSFFPFTVERCTFEANESTSTGSGSGGGGFFDSSFGGVELRNCTFFNNSAASGGGLYFDFGSGPTIDSCTISGNRSTGTSIGDGGGGIANSVSGSYNLGNSIVANNTAAVGGSDIEGEFTSLGFNLLGEAGGAVISGTTSGNILGVDPGLGPLALNGGVVRTMAPGSASPAVDAGRRDTTGMLLATDARAFSRPHDLPATSNAAGGDGADIGAVELTPASVLPSGAVITVNTTDATLDGVADEFHTSLPDAVFLATSTDNGVIEFDPTVFPPNSNQTISLSSPMLITGGHVQINGPGKDFLTVERASTAGLPHFSVLNIGGSAEVHLAGLTVARGIASDLANNDIPSGGGIQNLGTLVLSDCGLIGNSGVFGGGIYNSGSLTVINCVFAENSVTSSQNNGNGGAIYQDFGATAQISGSSFTDNSSVRANNRPGFGGAIRNSGDSMTLSDCLFARNSASTTAAVATSRPITVSRCVFEDNHAENSIGALDLSGGGSEVVDTRFSRNTATTANGGAARCAGPNTFRRCLFEKNSCGREGGALNLGGASIVESCTFTGNSSDPDSISGKGGAIFISTGANFPPVITHSTIQGNSANSGGGIFIAQGSVQAAHTILANNTATTTGNDLIGSATSLGYCLLEDTAGGDLSAGTGNLFNVDPQLMPLADNGSFNGLSTHALAATSPALDGGDPTFATLPYSDQRGLPRVAGTGIDIGAHENAAPFQSYDDFATATFPPGTAAERIGVGDDFDGDGVINGLEKLMNSDATDPADGPGLLSVRVDDGFLVLQLPLARDFSPDDAEVEHGGDLSKWVRSGTAWEIVGPINGATDQLEVRIPLLEGGPYFARLFFP